MLRCAAGFGAGSEASEIHTKAEKLSNAMAPVRIAAMFL
jgi:hypothetical protein